MEAKLHAQRSTENSPAVPRLQRSADNSPAIARASPAPTRAYAHTHAHGQPVQQTKFQQTLAQSTSSLKDSDGSGSGSGLLGTAVYCSMKHTGKAGTLQKYVVCITCENYDATICCMLCDFILYLFA